MYRPYKAYPGEIIRIKSLPECAECGEEIQTDFCYVTDRDYPRDTAVCQACADRIMKACRSVSDHVADLLVDYFRDWETETARITNETEIIFDPDNMRACR